MTPHERYNRSAKGRARQQRYRDTDKGHTNERKSKLRYVVKRRAQQLEEDSG